MDKNQNARQMRFRYDVGALVTLALSVGAAMVVYGGGIIPFYLTALPAWIFGPVGAYTLVYAFIVGKDSLFYTVWGSVMVAIAAASALSNIVNVYAVFGVLIIILAIIGLLAYVRRKP